MASFAVELFFAFNHEIRLRHRARVKLVIKADKDRKIKFCCLQSEAAEPYMRICGVDREDVLRRFLFIEGPDAYHQGSTG
ncbi:thiol-disulfide oxidoreductase DCC [Artemisia annua]|uniref:Thiol-disulfide oxidoreductase DCC n=1 Tax=Artemisia annua TaxID=35608 RepID=A0A2U1KA00_ARTAN|nr:thiol-disulfide oxidoreductase DCC [Artemisia annua]